MRSNVRLVPLSEGDSLFPFTSCIDMSYKCVYACAAFPFNAS